MMDHLLRILGDSSMTDEQRARLCAFDSLETAWLGTDNVSDLAWMASRFVLRPDLRTIVALALVGGATPLTHEKDVKQALLVCTSKLANADDDTLQAMGIMLATLPDGEDVQIGPSCTCRYTKAGRKRAMVWNVIYASVLTIGGEASHAAKHATFAFEIAQTTIKRQQISGFFRHAIPFAEIEEEWWKSKSQGSA